ncbi:TetR/AcrR family transcriptional regulator [Microtetraspora sp. AC03309]|uniref:TetR/AcrR family transcriptional regulator n=1 Tax=Microtetraspora sp. AC03309 TaxID=2779376 RepID=UPI001E56920F|nr:TetR/AcrR family transcriptional regulator [Microtetraspora sp. AC03309]MCC5576349.1 TetR/AcrR family transcriptional regulator [Microtetraspora sp. AC03309]
MAATRSGAGSARNAAGGTRGSDRRAELLGIAARLFATQGYARTTVRDIAEDAGILSGSLYHHFSSKEAMLDEILRDFLGQLLVRFTEIEKREGVTPKEKLDELVLHAFVTIHDSPHAVALYQKESGALSHQAAFEYVNKYSHENDEVWLRVLAAGQQSGAFRADIDVDLLYRSMRDSIWATVRWYQPGGGYDPAELAEHFLGILYGGLLAR